MRATFLSLGVCALLLAFTPLAAAEPMEGACVDWTAFRERVVSCVGSHFCVLLDSSFAYVRHCEPLDMIS